MKRWIKQHISTYQELYSMIWAFFVVLRLNCFYYISNTKIEYYNVPNLTNILNPTNKPVLPILFHTKTHKKYHPLLEQN